MTRTEESSLRSTPARLSLVPAPQPDLPYDDERPESLPSQRRSPGSRTGRRVGTQGTLALAFPLPSGVPAVPTPSPRLRVVARDLAAGRSAQLAEPTTAGRPAPTRWAALLAQAIVEAEVGDRPMTQLVRWTNDEVYDAVSARRAAHRQRSLGPRRDTARALVASIHVCQVGPDVAEACAVIRWGGRARAVALRLEGVGDTWRCTAAQLG